MLIDAFTHLEFEGELDNDFLARYATGRTTIDAATMFVDDEDDDFGWLDEATEEEEPFQIEEPEQLTAKQKRYLYQQRYRKGLIPAAEAKEFSNRKIKLADGTLKPESRRKLAYFLPPDLIAELSAAARAKGVKRREYVGEAVASFLDSNAGHEAIVVEVPFPDRKFLFDEIPSDLWIRLDRYCRAGGDKRKVRLYQVAEIAIRAAMRVLR